MTGKIFISYRRDDAAGDARSIRDALAVRFGKSNVFMDVDNLLAGQRFDRELDKALTACDVLIAVIGPRWLELLAGRMRGSERDYVRGEIAAAIQRGILVIPVRVGHEGRMVPLPRDSELPADIAELVLYQKHDVLHERFGGDMERLALAIRAARQGPGSRPWGRIAGFGAAGVALVAGAVMAVQLGLLEPGPKPAGEVPAAGEAARKADEERQRAEAEAKRDPALAVVPGSGDSFRDKLADGKPCPSCPEMVVLPAGTFTMGSPDNEEGRSSDEGPRHDVTIAVPFAVGRFEVTRGQYATFIKATGHKTADSCYVWNGTEWKDTPGKSWRDPGYQQSDDHPVACVSWDDAKAYVAWLANETGRGYRLLSEAEWEYAARAGSTTAYSWGATASHANANYGKFECCDGLATGKDKWVNTAPVGQFPANAFGLYDMHGNVWEWVEDCYEDSYSSAPKDGAARTTSGCNIRVIRGGSWINSLPWILRAADRYRLRPGYRLVSYGFRVARTL